MFPNSPFAHPVSSFVNPVPLVGVDPDADPLVCVSFSAAYLPYVIGALKQLLLQSTWNTNDMSALDLQQQRVFDLIYLFSVAQPCTNTILNSGLGGDFMTLIRQNPANSCILEGSFDNITWVTIYDGSKCFNPGTSPGGGTSQPAPGGGTSKNCYTLQANGILNLGTPVSAGDIITLDVGGSGWDGVETDFGPLWRCPDGSQFIAGACVGFSVTSGSDPVPTANHMSTIISIAGTFYSIMPGVPFSVPAGVTNVTPFIQVNDSAIGNNQGSYNVCVTIQNNQGAPFTHSGDFTLTPDSWNSGHTTVPPLSDSTWSASAGWLPGGDGSHTRLLLERTFASTQITSVSVTYTIGSAASPISSSLRAFNGASLVADSGAIDLSAGTHTVVLTVNALCTQFQFDIFTNSIDTFKAISWVVVGTGTNPF